MATRVDIHRPECDLPPPVSAEDKRHASRAVDEGRQDVENQQEASGGKGSKAKTCANVTSTAGFVAVLIIALVVGTVIAVVLTLGRRRPATTGNQSDQTSAVFSEKCTGEAEACASFLRAPYSCAVHRGCNYDDTYGCIGAPTKCSGLTNRGACTTQRGCVWGEDGSNHMEPPTGGDSITNGQQPEEKESSTAVNTSEESAAESITNAEQPSDNNDVFSAMYQVGWGAGNEEQSCSTNNARPIMTAKCANFVELQMEEEQEGCTKISDDSIECKALSSKANTARVRCAGYGRSDLSLEVTVKSGRYRCDKLIDHDYTASYLQEYWDHGGAAYHEASIQVMAVDGTTWDPVSDEECAGDEQQLGEDGCVSSALCTARKLVTKLTGTTEGKDHCYVTIPSLRVTAYEQKPVPHATAGTAGAGSKCTYDSTCQSGVCVGGVCANERQVEDGAACAKTRHCTNNVCAKYGETSNLTCCPSGEATEGACTEQPQSSPCTFDDICSSRICVEGSCRDGQQINGSTCRSNSHCKSGICIDGECTGARLEAGSICLEDDDCKNRACATYGSQGQLYCCPSNESIESSGGKRFCTEQDVGAACGSNHHCQSNICIQALCREERLPSHHSCEADSDCVSDTCAYYDGGKACCPTTTTIQHEGKPFCKVEKERKCVNDKFCLDSVCARSKYEKNSPKVCCKDGKSVEMKTPHDQYEEDFYCQGHNKHGERCGANHWRDTFNWRLCEGPKATCARESFTENAPWICCASGEYEYIKPCAGCSSWEGSYYCKN